MEYIKAGRELNNCLKNWGEFNGTVYGIIKNGKYVAAAELDGKRIVQAHIFDNEDIEKNEKVNLAFCEWKKKNGLLETTPAWG